MHLEHAIEPHDRHSDCVWLRVWLKIQPDLSRHFNTDSKKHNEDRFCNRAISLAAGTPRMLRLHELTGAGVRILIKPRDETVDAVCDAHLKHINQQCRSLKDQLAILERYDRLRSEAQS